MYKVLVIGIGNPVRGDDAVGCHAAHALEQMYRGDPQVEVMAVHQLTPELADDISQSVFVLFLDACAGGRPGAIRQHSVAPTHGSRSFSHHLNPASLLAAAESLYGDAPAAGMLTIVGASFEVGEQLSPVTMAKLPELVRLAQEIIAAHRTLRQPRKFSGAR